MKKSKTRKELRKEKRNKKGVKIQPIKKKPIKEDEMVADDIPREPPTDYISSKRNKTLASQPADPEDLEIERLERLLGGSKGKRKRLASKLNKEFELYEVIM